MVAGDAHDERGAATAPAAASAAAAAAHGAVVGITTLSHWPPPSAMACGRSRQAARRCPLRGVIALLLLLPLLLVLAWTSAELHRAPATEPDPEPEPARDGVVIGQDERGDGEAARGRGHLAAWRRRTPVLQAGASEGPGGAAGLAAPPCACGSSRLPRPAARRSELDLFLDRFMAGTALPRR